MIKILHLLIIVLFCTGCSNNVNVQSRFLIDNVSSIDNFTFRLNFKSDKDFSTRPSHLTVGSYIYCTDDPKIQSPNYTPDNIAPSLLGVIPPDRKLENIGGMYVYREILLFYTGDINHKPKNLSCRIFTGSTLLPLKSSNMFTISLP